MHFLHAAGFFVAFGLNVFIGFKLYGEKKIACSWIFVVSFSFVLLSANGVHGSAS